MHSQLFTDKEDTKAMIFPVKKEGKTKGLVMAVLENKGTNLRYTPLEKLMRDIQRYFKFFSAR